MSRLLSAAAALLGHLLGLARLFDVPCLSFPLLVMPCTVMAQVPYIPVLPGDYTPQTGGEP